MRINHRISLQHCEPFITKDGSMIRELLAHRNSSIRNQSLAEATIPPQVQTLSHYHPQSEEIYYILEGSGTMCLGTEVFVVDPGDAIAIPPGTIHSILNHTTQPLRLLCCCAPGYEHEDTVMVNPRSDPKD
ncbi:MAG: cupin domain-containing protein [Planctomycetes bacterium]|nr:cupin domain-containing protein [Planctomycetota bacterium]